MPAQITHYLHGKKILEKTNIDVDKSAFYFGTQGPDFFFFHRYHSLIKGEVLRKYGHAFHKIEPAKLLCLMQKLSEKSYMLKSYYQGFVCHYSLDSICHPYINAKALEMTDDLQDEVVCHGEIESNIDLMLREDKKFNIKNIVPKNKEFYSELAEMFAKIIKEILNEDVSEKRIMQTFSDCRIMFGILNDSSGMKRKIMDKIEKNKAHTLSSHLLPTKITKRDFSLNGQTKTFEELFEKSIERATQLVGGFDKDKFISITNNESF